MGLNRIYRICRKSKEKKMKGFPRFHLAATPEWGSGGRRFESSRPDIARPAVTTSYSGPCFTCDDTTCQKVPFQCLLTGSPWVINRPVPLEKQSGAVGGWPGQGIQ